MKRCRHLFICECEIIMNMCKIVKVRKCERVNFSLLQEIVNLTQLAGPFQLCFFYGRLVRFGIPIKGQVGIGKRIVT